MGFAFIEFPPSATQIAAVKVSVSFGACANIGRRRHNDSSSCRCDRRVHARQYALTARIAPFVPPVIHVWSLTRWRAARSVHIGCSVGLTRHCLPRGSWLIHQNVPKRPRLATLPKYYSWLRRLAVWDLIAATGHCDSELPAIDPKRPPAASDNGLQFTQQPQAFPPQIVHA